jgi:SSS family solute:Na+ symporter
MGLADWIVLISYVLLIIAMSYFIGKKQKNQEDYYLGGKKLKSWQIGGSLVANQVSAISLVGVPAFIALKQGGGLKWLQYELAVPLSMIFIILFLLPKYKKYSRITIYEYLEKRFGSSVRTTMSTIFILSRGLATGVALLATAYVTSIAMNLELKTTIFFIGIISLIYTSLGGIKADVYSDIIQLLILWIASIASIFVLYKLLGGNLNLSEVNPARLKIFDFSSTGINDGNTFSFIPMIIGGFFLYISYYGCDQSQAQRLLTTKSEKEARKALALNSYLRFPLVLTYSAVGVLILIFLTRSSEFLLKVKKLPPDYLMPVFFKEYMPTGVFGLIVAGVFAASMSSLDSAINSLSASLWDDILVKVFPSLNKISDKKKVGFSRYITIFWGFLAIGFAITIANGSETVVELVNKIGSAFYGPVAAVFSLGVWTKIKNQKIIILSLFSGVFFNIFLWLFFQKISWLYWNPVGFFITFFSAITYYLIIKRGFPFVFDEEIKDKPYIFKLTFWFMILILTLFIIEKTLLYF